MICSQLESSCPQTSSRSSNTLSAEFHNPGLRTSPHACWCQCLAPSAAGEPVDPPWMSSSAGKCKKYDLRGRISLRPSLVWLTASCSSTSVAQTRSVFVAASLMQVAQVRKSCCLGGAGHRQVGSIAGSNYKQMCNKRAVTTGDIQTRIRLEEWNNHCFILCVHALKDNTLPCFHHTYRKETNTKRFFRWKGMQEGLVQVRLECGRWKTSRINDSVVFLCNANRLSSFCTSSLWLNRPQQTFWQTDIRINGHE